MQGSRHEGVLLFNDASHLVVLTTPIYRFQNATPHPSPTGQSLSVPRRGQKQLAESTRRYPKDGDAARRGESGTRTAASAA